MRLVSLTQVIALKLVLNDVRVCRTASPNNLLCLATIDQLLLLCLISNINFRIRRASGAVSRKLNTALRRIMHRGLDKHSLLFWLVLAHDTLLLPRLLLRQVGKDGGFLDFRFIDFLFRLVIIR